MIRCSLIAVNLVAGGGYSLQHEAKNTNTLGLNLSKAECPVIKLRGSGNPLLHSIADSKINHNVEQSWNRATTTRSLSSKDFKILVLVFGSEAGFFFALLQGEILQLAIPELLNPQRASWGLGASAFRHTPQEGEEFTKPGQQARSQEFNPKP